VVVASFCLRQYSVTKKGKTNGEKYR